MADSKEERWAKVPEQVYRDYAGTPKLEAFIEIMLSINPINGEFGASVRGIAREFDLPLGTAHRIFARAHTCAIIAGGWNTRGTPVEHQIPSGGGFAGSPRNTSGTPVEHPIVDADVEVPPKSPKENIGRRVNYQPYMTAWNYCADQCGWPVIIELNDDRKAKIRTRSKEPNFRWKEILDKARKASGLRGATWLTFDWLITNQKNYIKVLEGNYDKSFGGERIGKPQVKEKGSSGLPLIEEDLVL